MLEGHSYSYRDLAALSEAIELSNPNVHRANLDLQTALVLYKSLEENKALCLLSTSASAEEVVRCTERLVSASLINTALVLFSSGSGGLAKGVRLSKRALRASAKASEQRLKWFGSDR